MTALIHASDFGNKDCVILLIKAGANINLKNNEGYTALIYAKKYKHKKINTILSSWKLCVI